MAQFSNNAVQRIRQSVKWTEAQRTDLRGPKNEPMGRRGYRPILARITGVAALGSKTSQWIYTITQVKLTVTASSGTPSAVSIEDVDGGIEDGKALNVAELANVDAGVAFGTDQAGADYPEGFAPRPISGGGADATHKQDVLAYVVGRVTASDGSTIYLIDRMGTHDGGCEE